MPTTLFHIAPTINRDSIARHGLKAKQWFANRPAPGAGSSWDSDEPPPWATKDWQGFRQRMANFAIPGQPEATYLAEDLQGALTYAQHLWERIRPQKDSRLYSLDVWSVTVPEGITLEPDTDWVTPAVWTESDIAPEHLTRLGTISVAAPRLIAHGYPAYATF
jgi:hypothetical protein